MKRDPISIYNDNQTTVSEVCNRDLQLLKKAIFQQQLWALKMLDASSKIPSGILQGNIIDLGTFDECIASQGQFHNVEFHGRYCMYTFGIANITTIQLHPKLSICVPSSCTEDDIKNFINNTINSIEKLKDFQVSVKSVTCSAINQKIWNLELIAYTSVFVVFVGFLIISTICDIFHSISYDGKSNSSLLRHLTSFSLRRSIHGIFSTNIKEGNLSIIYGIRFLSMAWVIIGHTFLTNTGTAVVNMIDVSKLLITWEYIYVYTAPFAVDTFFALSGLLMTYMFLKQIRKQKTFNIPMYYLHRYLRLTPAIIATLVIATIFVPKLASGPHWQIASGSVCRKNWWYFLFYIQNLMGSHQECLQHLWYVAVDMQLFIISPIILYPLYKKPKIGLAITGLLLIISLAVTAAIIAINRYPMASVKLSDFSPELTAKMFSDVYNKPYTRGGPWLIGILFGYEIVNKHRRLNKSFAWIGWFFTTGIFAICIFGTRYFVAEDYEYDVVLETIFSTVSRPLWGFAICWLIYASTYNNAGIIKTILSWKVFIPLSRLSYCMYLIHAVIQNAENAFARTSVYFSHYGLWNNFFGNLSMSFLASIFICLLFESPTIILERMLFRRKRESQAQLQDNLRSIDVENSEKKF
ncbi:PREDICTED: nose resistant to fluoxetine protein 6-like [Ceratosolen solmsi marchali]|uniref:Nose resistant to fluoxetine protein 6-like n=1 Tax=Ceratosolen solmsi marchali TaxID=326594 RepID=A0AAJ6YCY8_9HYME|nr:PREDICTED: nose resistant to fluoxetine protein 6-like [Ceratosolen solmsi marchali]